MQQAGPYLIEAAMIPSLPLLLLTLLILSDAASETVKAEGWVFETVAKGETSEITQERREAIRGPMAWSAFWRAHAGPGSSVPLIDFHKDMVIVVHLGSRPTAGYAVQVTRIENQAEKLAVYYSEERPGPRCIVAQVITHPFHIIKLPRTEKEPSFIRSEKILDCF